MVVLPFAAAAVVSAAASAQIVHVPLGTLPGDTPQGQCGRSVAGAGDVDNDGFDDLIIGIPFADFGKGARAGAAMIISGRTGDSLNVIPGDAPQDNFGASVDGVGDVDADAHDDFIIGAPFSNSAGQDAGIARIYSGRTGEILFTFVGSGADDQFGTSVSAAGDVNDDGVPDVIVGAPSDDENGSNSGAATVFSGADGSVLYVFRGNSAEDQFGVSVSGAGDFDNDGFDDVIIGAWLDAPNGPNSGSARVHSGRTGELLYLFIGDAPQDQFGVSVSGAGDVNNDGSDDVIVGAWLSNAAGIDSGRARVFAGATGAILHTFNGDAPGDGLGYAVGAAGDVDNDGFDDVIIGARQADSSATNAGLVRVYSGQTGLVIRSFSGDAEEDQLGIAVAGAGDVNNDGVADFIAGAPSPVAGGPGFARVYVSLIVVPCPDVCQGDADRNGVVNFADLTSVLVQFSDVCFSAGAGWGRGSTGCPTLCAGDADGSGVVNFADLTAVILNFRNACGSLAFSGISADNRGLVALVPSVPLDAASVPGSATIWLAGRDFLLDTPDDAPLETTVSIDASTGELRVRAAVPVGTPYRVAIDASRLQGAGGERLDGEFRGATTPTGDGSPGGDTRFGVTTAATPVARFRTALGVIDVDLLSTQTRATVQNFLFYANSAAWDGTFFHRSVADFVIQAGGFRAATGFPAITAIHPVQNEPGVSNIRGTLAMAKLANNPNSATNQWFFNVADNSANLNAQNGGFTVFGRIRDAQGLAVMDAVAALARYNASAQNPAFNAVPVRDLEPVETRGELLPPDTVLIERVSILMNVGPL